MAEKSARQIRTEIFKKLDVPKQDWSLPSGAVIAFAHGLHVPAGPKVAQPLRLKDFQIEFIRDVYNPRREDGRRLRRQAVLSVGRRNGKSLTAAVLLLAHLVGPLKKPNSHIVSAALTRKQASLIYQYAMYIVQASKALRDRVKVLESTKRLIYRDDGSYYEAIAAEAGGQFGMGLDFCIYDELGQARDRRLYDTLMTSLGSQPEGLMMIISTQAATDQHILSELIDYGERIKGTDQDPSFTCHLYTHPKDMPITDRRGWKMANPGMGDYRDEEELATAVKRAKSLPSDEAAVRQFLLNQRVQAESPFLSPDVYEGNGNSLPFDPKIFFDGRPVHGGLDLSGRADLTALVLACEDDEGNVPLMPFGWTPQDTLLARQARDRAPYDAWVRSGQLFATPGSYIDYDWVAQQIGEITTGMNVTRLEYDPWRIDILAAAFARIGGMMPLFKRPQTFQFMSPCIEAFEELALAGRLRHGNHPVLKFCMANTVVLRNAEESRKLDKAKSFGRIDLAQAAVMAVGSLKIGPPAIEVAALIA